MPFHLVKDRYLCCHLILSTEFLASKTTRTSIECKLGPCGMGQSFHIYMHRAILA